METQLKQNSRTGDFVRSTIADVARIRTCRAGQDTEFCST